MGILIALIIGGLAGYIASLLLNRDAQQGIVLNVIVGIVGAFLGNLLLAPVFGVTSSLSQPTLAGFAIAVAGSVILLAVVNLVTRKRLR